jgi:RnfABCDGE-type electron transport complex G subunit
MKNVMSFLKKNWPEVIRPVVVLVVICICVSAALAVTNFITAPVIAEGELLRNNGSRVELFPAEAYNKLEGEWDGVAEAYDVVTGGEVIGYIITGVAKGYGGDVPVLVAIDTAGSIVGIQISGTEETQGLGSKIEESAFKDQFKGLAAAPVTLNTEVQQVAGATVSSSAAVAAVNKAIDAYTVISGGELVKVDHRAELFPAESYNVLDGAWEGVAEACEVVTGGEVIGHIVTGIANGYGGEVSVLVAFDPAGTVMGVEILGDDETQGLGSKIAEAAFKDQFKGLAAAEITLNTEIQQIASATVSSTAAVDAFNSAVAAYTVITGKEA